MHRRIDGRYVKSMRLFLEVEFGKSCAKILRHSCKEPVLWPLFQEPPFVDSFNKPVYNDISVTHSLLLRNSHIFEIAEDLTPRFLVVFVVIRYAPRCEPSNGSDAFFAMAAFVVLLQPLQRFQYKNLAIVYQGRVEAVKHRHAGDKALS
jgi:hypothetical protein